MLSVMCGLACRSQAGARCVSLTPAFDRGAVHMNPGYKNLLTQLVTLHRRAETGVLHLYTEKNEYGRLALDKGLIQHVSLHTQRGTAAVPLLLQSSIRSQRFEAGATLPATAGLPDTPTLLETLGADVSMLAGAAPEPQPAPSASPVAAPTKAAGAAIAPAALALIETELARELGSMAGSLVKECAPKAADALALTRLLAEQLMPNEGELFFVRTSNLLRALD